MMDLIQLFAEQLQAGQFLDLGAWNYPLLGILIILQEPVFTLLGARAAATGSLHPAGVLTTAVTANLLVDFVSYLIGWSRFFGGRRRFAWRFWGYRIGPSRRTILRFQQAMRQHAIKALVLAQFSPGLAIPSLVAAGMSQVPWRRWFPVVVLAEITRSIAYVLIGYYATHAFQKINPAWAGAIILTLILCFFAANLIRRYLYTQ